MDTQLSHLEQYKMLREEIMHNIQQMYRTELVTAIAAATVYAWLLLHRHDAPDVPRIYWFVPPFLIFAATLRILTLWIQISFVAGYLRRIEEATFGKLGKLGTVTYFFYKGQAFP